MVGTLVPEVDEGFEFVGVFGGEVLDFAAVLGEVVKFPWLVVAGDRFPIILEDGVVTFVGPPESFVKVGLICFEDGEEAFTGEGIPFFVREAEDGGEEVDDVGGGVAEFVLRGDALWPVGDEWSGDASFVGPGFVFAEGSVGGGGPTGAEAEVSFGGAHGGFWIVAVAADHDLGAGSIVGEEDDEGVVEAVGLFEVLDDSSDLLIHAVDHGGVDGHFAGLEGLLGFGEGVPRNWAVDFVGS